MESILDQPNTTPPSATTPPSPTFAQNWGHFAWTLPMALMLTLVTGHPASIVIFITSDLIQFERHARKHHPGHPILETMTQCVVGVLIIGACAIGFASGAEVVNSFGQVLGLGNLVLVEILFSRIIHEREHNADPRKRFLTALPLAVMGLGSLIVGAILYSM